MLGLTTHRAVRGLPGTWKPPGSQGQRAFKPKKMDSAPEVASQGIPLF